MKLNEFIEKVKPLKVSSLTKIRGGQGQASIIIEMPVPRTGIVVEDPLP